MKNEFHANFRNKNNILAKQQKTKTTTIVDQSKLQHVNNKS